MSATFDDGTPHDFPVLVFSGRYRLLARLAGGGMGTVYVGQQLGVEGFQRLVAVKRAHPHLLQDAEFRRMLVTEGKLASLVHHPNVVDVLGGGAEPDPHVVMEYLDGGDLGREIVRAGRLSIDRTLEVGTAVANALAAASDAGVIHGDVKPSNVLLGSDGAIKLADFNVARVTGVAQSTAKQQQSLF